MESNEVGEVNFWLLACETGEEEGNEGSLVLLLLLLVLVRGGGEVGSVGEGKEVVDQCVGFVCVVFSCGDEDLVQVLEVVDSFLGEGEYV